MTPRSPADLLHRRLVGRTYAGRWVTVEDIRHDTFWSKGEIQTVLDDLCALGRVEKDGEVYRGVQVAPLSSPA